MPTPTAGRKSLALLGSCQELGPRDRARRSAPSRARAMGAEWRGPLVSGDATGAGAERGGGGGAGGGEVPEPCLSVGLCLPRAVAALAMVHSEGG